MPEKKRVAIVTGAASGIGAAIADALRAQSVRVIGVDRAAWADVTADLSSPKEIAGLGATLPEWDILIHAAGLAGDADPAQVLIVNLIAARKLTRVLAPKAKDGAVVLGLASVAAALSPMPEGVVAAALDLDAEDGNDFTKEHSLNGPMAYRLSKQALVYWARREAAQQRVYRALTVSPGPIKTPLWERARAASPSAADAFLHHVPHVPAPEEIAPAIAALCGPTFRWLNGVDISLDGGLRARLDQSVSVGSSS